MRRRFLLIASLSALGAIHQVGCTGESPHPTGTTGSGGDRTTASTAGSGGGGGGTSSASSTTVSSSSSSSAASSSSSSASSTASSSSGAGPMPEDCTNGVDDDLNGLVDCADPACTAYGCVASAPGGWNGPVALYDGDPALVPPCPADYPDTAYQGHAGLLPQQPATCGACTCAAPPLSCTAAALTFTGDAACASGLGSAAQPAVGVCGAIQPPAGTQGFTAGPPVAVAGSCAPGGGTKTLPPAAWSRAALACNGGGLGLGCPAGTNCSGTPVAPFVPALCIYRAGDLACPAGFGDKHRFTDNVVDTRDCGPCTCGASVASCTATTQVFADGSCGGVPLDLVDDGSCAAAAGSAGSIQSTVTGMMASCPPAGGQPSGTIVEGAQKTTVCCAQ